MEDEVQIGDRANILHNLAKWQMNFPERSLYWKASAGLFIAMSRMSDVWIMEGPKESLLTALPVMQWRMAYCDTPL